MKPYRRRPPALTASVVPPHASPLPRFAAPADRSPSFAKVHASPARFRSELRPLGERLLVHCYPNGSGVAIAILPAEHGPSRVRVSLPGEITEALGALAELAGPVAAGAIFDATVVERPGFRAVGAAGAPLADALVISDLPFFDGDLLIGRPWIERREILEELITALDRPSVVTLSEIREVHADAPITTPAGHVVVLRDTGAAYLARPAR